MPPLIGRYVPFAAVAAANCINIPCMRSRYDTDRTKIAIKIWFAKIKNENWQSYSRGKVD